MLHKRVIIIGAGIGGLATAALLAKDGYQVTVLEKNEQAGGRASVLAADGYRFDMGPSWYMMPEIFERYYQEFGRTTTDFYQLTKLNPQYRVFFADQEYLDITGEIEQDKATFERLDPGFSRRFDAYLAESRQKYRLAIDHVLYKNADHLWQLLSWPLLMAAPQMGLHQPMHQYLSRFFQHPKIQQILEYNLVFLGCSPQNAPALFSLMTHVDWNLGVWYPTGGMAAITQALVQLGQAHGVTYVYNQPVQELRVQQGRISEVVTAGGTYPAEVVISNADYKHTEDLLSDQRRRRYPAGWWQSRVLAPSAFLLYLGLKGQIPKLRHHSLYFGQGWEQHFREVFATKVWPTDPSVYLNVTSKTDPTVAPAGHENVMILVPVAAGLAETPSSRQQYAQFILDFLARQLGITWPEIAFQRIFSVSDFTSRYHSYQGNALGGLAHTFSQSAIWRPSNASRRVANLFFAGANTVPGIGVPPAVISSHLVRERVHRYLPR